MPKCKEKTVCKQHKSSSSSVDTREITLESISTFISRHKSPSSLGTENESTLESTNELFSKAFDKASEDIHEQRMFIKSCKEKLSLSTKADKVLKQKIKNFRKKDFAKRRLYTEHRYIGVGNGDDAFQSTEQIREMTTPEILVAFWQTTQTQELKIDEVPQAVAIVEGEVPERAESPSQTSLHKTIEDFPTDDVDFDERKEGELIVHSPLTPDILGAKAEDIKAVCSPGSIVSDRKVDITLKEPTKAPVAPPESTLNIDEVPQAVSIMKGEVPEHAESPSHTSLHETFEDFSTDHRDFDERKEGELMVHSPLTIYILGGEADDIKAMSSPGSMDSDSICKTTIRKPTKSPGAESTLNNDAVAQADAIMEGEVPERAESPSPLPETIEDFPTYHGDFDERKEGELIVHSPLTPDILGGDAEDIKAVTSPGYMDSDSKDVSTISKFTESVVAPPQSILNIDEVAQAVSIMEEEAPGRAESPSHTSLPEPIEDFPTYLGDSDERKEGEQIPHSPLTLDILGAEAQDIKAVTSPGSIVSDSKDESTYRKPTEFPVGISTLISDAVPLADSIMEEEVPGRAESPSETSLHEAIEDFSTDHRDFDERMEGELIVHSPLTIYILTAEAEDIKAVTSPGSMDSDSKDESTIRKPTEFPVGISTLISDAVPQADSIMEGEVPGRAESPSETSLHETIEDFSTDHRDSDERKEGELIVHSPLTIYILSGEAEDIKAMTSPGSMDSDSKDESTISKSTESPVVVSTLISDAVPQADSIMEEDVPERAESPSETSLHEAIEDFSTDHRDFDERKEGELIVHSPLTIYILNAEAEDIKAVTSPGSMDSDRKDESTISKSTESPVGISTLISDAAPQADSIMEEEVPERAESPSETSLHKTIEDFSTDHVDFDERKEGELIVHSPLTIDILSAEAEDIKAVTSPGSMDSDSKDESTYRKPTESPVGVSTLISDAVPQADSIMEEEVPERAESPSETSLHEAIEDFSTDHRDFDERKEGELIVHSPLTIYILTAEAEDIKAVTSPGSMDSDSKDESTYRKPTESPVGVSTLISDAVPQADSIMEEEVPERAESPSETSLHEAIEDFSTDHGDFDERKEGELIVHSPLTIYILTAEAEDIKAVTTPGSMDSDSKDESTYRKPTEFPVGVSTLISDAVPLADSIMEEEVPERAESPRETSLHEAVEDFSTDHRDFDERKEGELIIHSPLTIDILSAEAEDIKAVTSPGSMDSDSKDESTISKSTESPVGVSTLINDAVPQADSIVEEDVPESAESPGETSLHEAVEDFSTDHRDFDERKEGELIVHSPLTIDILGAEAEDIKAVTSPGYMDSDSKDESTISKTIESPVGVSTLISDAAPQADSIMEEEVPERAESPSETSLHETIEDFSTDHVDFDERKEGELIVHSPLTIDILGAEAEDIKAVTSPGSMDSDSKDELTYRKPIKSPVGKSTLISDEVALAVAIMEREIPECAESPSETSLHEKIDDFPTDHGDLTERKEGEPSIPSPLTIDILSAEAEDIKAVTSPGSMDSDSKDESTYRKPIKSPVVVSTLISDAVPQADSIMEEEVPEHAEIPSETSLKKAIEDFPTDHGEIDKRKEGELTIHSPLTPDILGAEAEDIKAVCSPRSMDSDSKDETTKRDTMKSPVAPPESTLKITEVPQAVAILEGEELPERAESPSETSLHETIEDFSTDHRDFDERKEGELTIRSPLTPDTLGAETEDIKAVSSPGSMDSDSSYKTAIRKPTKSPVSPPESTLISDEVAQAVSIMEGEVPEREESPSQTALHETIEDFPTDHGGFDERKEGELTVHSPLTRDFFGAEAEDIKAICSPGSRDSDSTYNTTYRKTAKSHVTPPESTLNIDEVPQADFIMEGEVPECPESPSETSSHEIIEDFSTYHRDFDERKEGEQTVHCPLTPDIMDAEAEDVKAVTSPGSMDSDSTYKTAIRKTIKSPVAPPVSILNIDEVAQAVSIMEGLYECQPDTWHSFTQTLQPETSNQSTQTLESNTCHQSTQTDVNHQCVSTLIEVVISRSARQSKLCPSEFLKEHLLGKILDEIKGNDLNLTPKRVKHLDKVIVEDMCKLLLCKEKDLLDIMNLMDPVFDKVIISILKRHLLALSETSHLNFLVQDEKYRFSVENCVEQFVTYVRKHSDRICTVKEADAISQRIFIQLWTKLKGEHDKIPLEIFSELSKVVYKDLCKKWGSPRAILFSMQLNIPEHDEVIVDTFRQHLMKSKKEQASNNLDSRIYQWF